MVATANFLEIRRAFSKVSTKTIKETLAKIGLEGCFRHWIVSMLRTRIMQSDLASSHLIIAVSRGTSQSGLISPVLWLIVRNETLPILGRSGIKVVVYVDDLLFGVGMLGAESWWIAKGVCAS